MKNRIQGNNSEIELDLLFKMNSPKGRRKEFDSIQDLLEIAKKPSNLP